MESRNDQGLRGGALSTGEAMIVSMGFMAPSVAMFFNTPFIAGFAGGAMPLAMLFSFGAVFLVALGLSQLARRTASAGSVYSIVSNAINPKTGFMGMWFFIIGYGIFEAATYSIFASFASEEMQRIFGIAMPWVIPFFVIAGLVYGLSVLGITQSVRGGLIFLAYEILIVTIMLVSVIAQGGAEGNTLAVFSPTTGSGLGGVFLGMIFGIMSFVGWKAAASLGEETRDPHTSIPRALLGAVAVIGIYYVFVTYAATIGFGPDNMDKFAGDAAWFDTLTRQYMGSGWAPFVGIAALTGAIASAIGIHNSTVRLLYALGRDGVLPRALAKVHPTRRSPWVAASVQAGYSVVLGLIFGYLVFGDPSTTYGYFGGLGTLAVLFVYIFINVSVFLYFRNKERENFSFVRHAIVPLAATAAVGLPIYGLIYPVPDPPYNLWPYLIALWAIIGFAFLFFISRRRPEIVEVMGRAFGESGDDEPDTTSDLPRRTTGRDITGERPRTESAE
ncbi:MAG TPA: APC family permease [Rubrobacteraceae bacterium]|nr:APC family permease [Rubrobacteraceae bacterium]